MVPFEHRVVDALVNSTDPDLRAAVVAYVEGCLADMPEHLRAGVLAESFALGAWSRVRSVGRDPEVVLRRQLAAWEHHPVDVIRQYVRLIGSLVQFAEVELADAASDAAPLEPAAHARRWRPR